MPPFLTGTRLAQAFGVCTVLLLFICSASPATETEQLEQSGKKLTTWQSIGLGGLLSAGLAGMAAYEPMGMGIIEVCVPPYLGVHGVLKAKHMWPVTIAFGGLGIYNLTVDEDRVSRGRIFGVNFAGMSAAAIVSALIHDPREPGNKREDRLKTGVSLGRHESTVTLIYSFKTSRSDYAVARVAKPRASRRD